MGEKDAGHHGDHKPKKSMSGFAHRKPPKETSLRASKEHPQRAIMMERERLRPAVSLEAWFDAGLVREKVVDNEDSNKKRKHVGQYIVKGSRPLPIGYNGCDGDTMVVKAASSGTLIWPIRLDIGELGADHQPPWTLYHYTHESSFERFHMLAHDMANMEPEEVRKKLYQLLQMDFQERVPNPTPQNVKGEPQVSPIEPIKFATKEEVLTHIFGKNTSGYSKQGNPWTAFADYCIAIRAPVSACFTIASHGAGAGAGTGGANVRLCRDTLQQMADRMERTREVARQNHGNKLSTPGAKKTKSNEDVGDGKVGCFGRWCGSKQKPPEFWDDVEPQQQQKKEKREVDRWKQRMARQWLNDHVTQVGRSIAAEKKKEAQENQYLDQREVKEVVKKNKVLLQINEPTQKRMPRLFSSPAQMVNKWQKKLSKSNSRASTRDLEANSAEVMDINKDSNLFGGFGLGGKKKDVGFGMDGAPEEGKVANTSIKQVRRNVPLQAQSKSPQGRRRSEVVRQKVISDLHDNVMKDADKHSEAGGTASPESGKSHHHHHHHKGGHASPGKGGHASPGHEKKEDDEGLRKGAKVKIGEKEERHEPEV